MNAELSPGHRPFLRLFSSAAMRQFCLAFALLLASAGALQLPGRPLASPLQPRRAPAPALRRAAGSQLFLDGLRERVKSLRGGSPDAPEDLPPPTPVAAKPESEMSEKEKTISAADKLLVQFGMKTEDECEVVEEGEDLMEQIKCAGRAGIISYIIWEWAFWIGAGGIAAFTYFQVTGHWPDFSNDEDKAQVAASAFALVNVARFAVPLRIGLALSTTPWVDDNIVKPFLGGDDAEEA